MRYTMSTAYSTTDASMKQQVNTVKQGHFFLVALHGQGLNVYPHNGEEIHKLIGAA